MTKTDCLLNCCNFNAADSYVFDFSNCIINKFGHLPFRYSPVGSFFYSWCGVQSNIAHKLSFLQFFIFSCYPLSIVPWSLTRGNYWFPNTISQPLRYFYSFCFCFRLCFNLIIHWIVVLSYFNNYTTLPKERENYSTASIFMWIKWPRQRFSSSIFGI